MLRLLRRNQGALILKIIQGKYEPVSSSKYSKEIRKLVDTYVARRVVIARSPTLIHLRVEMTL